MRLSRLVFLLLATGALAEPAVLLDDSFTASSLPSWTTKGNWTIATSRVVEPGQLSPTCLQVDKPDTSGFLTLARELAVPAGAVLGITADLRTERLGPFAEYFLMVTALDAAGKGLGPNIFLAFDDGVTKPNEFGGQFKSPQTLGQWKTTRHRVELPAGTVKARLTFVFRNGSQRFGLDNLRVVDARDQPAPRGMVVYQRQLDSAAAFLDLDMLAPGCLYELTGTTNSDDLTGFGVRLTPVDRHGRPGVTSTLLPVQAQARSLVYQVAVPDDAVSLRCDLFNTDLATMGPYQQAKYRQWRTVEVRRLVTPPAVDTLFHNYVHGGGPTRELARPRDMIQLTDYDRQVLDAHLAQRPVVDAEVKAHHGAMVIALGNQLEPPMIHAALHGLGQFDSYGPVARQGLHLLRLDDVKGGPALSGMWTKPGSYDFSAADAMIYRVLKTDPDAHLIYQILGMYPPAWWGDAHPEDLIRDSEGLVGSQFDVYGYGRLWGAFAGGELHQTHERRYAGNTWLANQGALGGNTTYLPSPASAAYRQAMTEYLTAFRRHVEAQPYGRAVVGYSLIWGYDGQWNWPDGSGDDEVVGQRGKVPGRQLDYSAPMRAWFHDWLRRKYRTAEALQAAWHDPKVTFDTAGIPSPERRFTKLVAVNGVYRDLQDQANPATEQDVIDYETAKCEVVGETLDTFGRALKAAAPRKVLVAAYFQDASRDLGHDLVLRGSGTDLIGGPNYEAREIGLSGISPQLRDSYRLHGKIECTEVDHRLFSATFRSYTNNQVFETPRKSISVLQREFSRQMVRGEGAWTFDMGFGWHNQPLLAETLGDIHRVWRATLDADHTSPAKIAVFCSDTPLHARKIGNFTRPYQLQLWIQATAAQSGVPVDLYRLADLPAVADRYQVLVFPFAYALTREEVASITATKRGGKILVFGPAAGFDSDGGEGDDRVAGLVGMTLARDDQLPMTIRVTQADHPLTRDLRGYFGGEESSQRMLRMPVYQVTDPAAVGLGEYGGAAGKFGFALKPQTGWTSVYVGAVAVFPPELFRGLARLAGLPVYSSDGDPLFFAQELLAVHASFDGVHTLTLPAAADVSSLWDDTALGRVKVIRRPMRTGDNALYRLRP